jgi:hypothetical protein
MAPNLATDLHHLAGIDAPVKVDQPDPQAGLLPSAGVAARSLDFRGFGIAQHLPLILAVRDNIVPLSTRQPLAVKEACRRTDTNRHRHAVSLRRQGYR